MESVESKLLNCPFTIFMYIFKSKVTQYEVQEKLYFASSKARKIKLVFYKLMNKIIIL